MDIRTEFTNPSTGLISSITNSSEDFTLGEAVAKILEHWPEVRISDGDNTITYTEAN